MDPAEIAHLYRMEENLRRQPGRSNKRAAVRLSQSRPIFLAPICALVLFKSRRYLPRSALDFPTHDALSNCQLQGVYLKDGQIDN